MDENKEKVYFVRVRADLYKRIIKLAKQNNRSINNMTQVVLADALEHLETKKDERL